MRKHANSILLLAMVYSVGTLAVFSEYYIANHRLTFQTQVRVASDKKLEKLFFKELEYREIQWFDDESEFEWHGKMYDVSKISRTSDGYIIVCEHDSFEEVLLALVNITKGKEQQGLKKGNPQPQFFSTLPVLTSQQVMTSDNISFNNLKSLYYSLPLEISSPPPRPINL